MPQDKFSATWVSHSSISDFQECPRSYYLKNVYKDQKTGHKIQLITPPLALGQAVHEVVEELSNIKTEERFRKSLLDRFAEVWKKVSGKKGGFVNSDVEYKYRMRGELMLKNLIDNPGPLENKTVKISQDLPHYWLSEKEELILCGRIDWLEYLPESDSVHIIDFKTGQGEEKEDSLQLAIYYLLVKNCQQREVGRVSYWYLEKSDGLREQPLPDFEEAQKNILEIARQIRLARKLDKFSCPQGGCRACIPYEKIIKGQAELVGLGGFDRDVYILPQDNSKKSEIL